ncbi:MAG: F0F1 ATP synthase subunit A [Candidatus Pacebacteria bacterium]|nr:F0F1 ATP synthase subunit A [Candidatus Paceibacterota bacterium]
MAGELHISISAETLFHLGPLAVSNSILTSLIVSLLIILFALLVRINLRAATKRPSSLQNLAEFVMESLYNLVNGVTNDPKRSWYFLPLILSFFLFIMLNNWLGLLPGVGTIGFRDYAGDSHPHQETTWSWPGWQAWAVDHQEASEQAQLKDTDVNDHQEPVSASHQSATDADAHQATDHQTSPHAGAFIPLFRAGTADLNTTLALGLISVALTQVIGFRFQRFGYFKKFINLSSPIMFFVGILETISEIAKIVSFAFRLFGNIFAGEVLLMVVGSLVPLIIPMPFYGLEIFVGFIQALVFSLLSLVFFNMATIGHDDH